MTYSPGLEGVVAGETSISNVEGDIGRLSYRGYVIEDIVNMDYLEVAYLVLFGDLPEEAELSAFAAYMNEHGRLANSDLAVLATVSGDLHPMKILQAMIPLLRLDDSVFADCNLETSQGLQIIAKLPHLIAEIKRKVEPDASVGEFDASEPYLTRYLSMMTGAKPSNKALEVFKTVQLLQMDHSFNAGTFASRVISSTLAPIPAVLSGAVGALSGVLHGGADEAALRAALEVGHPDNAGAYVDDILANKGRLMGMGHREYRTVDPRAVILKPLAEELSRGTQFQTVFETLKALEEVFNARMAEKGKDVWANLEYYKGAVYETLGITPPYFTASFALSRSVGWLAHFIESRMDNKIIRPAVDYVGRSVESVH